MPPALRWLFVWSLLGATFLVRLISAGYLPADGLYDLAGYLVGRDFVNIWMASKLTHAGTIAQAYDLHFYMQQLTTQLGEHFPFHNWSYPPSILPFIYPLGFMPYGLALIVWTILGILFYLLAARPKNLRQPYWPLALLIALSPAALVNLIGGQNGFFTAALFIGGFMLLNRRPVLAGILFGLLTLKPQLGLIIPLALLLLKRWKTIGAASATAILLFAISSTIWGIELWQHYFRDAAAYQYKLLETFKGFYTLMMPGPYAAARQINLTESTAFILHGAIAIAAAIAALSVVRREAASPRAILALAIAGFLATPYAYNYDLTAVSAAIVIYLATQPASNTRDRILYGLAWIVPAAVYKIMQFSLPLAPFPFIIMLAHITWRSAYPRRDDIRIVPFTTQRAPYFDQYNREWITKFFWLEPFDEELLTNPKSIIIDKGGEIWFAEQNGKPVAACALLRGEDGTFEFSKLGVAQEARGQGISHTLLHHCINRARLRNGKFLRIFTHSSLTTACALYRHEGFRDVEIPEAERARYQRADTLLVYQL